MSSFHPANTYKRVREMECRDGERDGRVVRLEERRAQTGDALVKNGTARRNARCGGVLMEAIV